MDGCLPVARGEVERCMGMGVGVVYAHQKGDGGEMVVVVVVVMQDHLSFGGTRVVEGGSAVGVGDVMMIVMCYGVAGGRMMRFADHVADQMMMTVAVVVVMLWEYHDVVALP